MIEYVHNNINKINFQFIGFELVLNLFLFHKLSSSIYTASVDKHGKAGRPWVCAIISASVSNRMIKPNG